MRYWLLAATTTLLVSCDSSDASVSSDQMQIAADVPVEIAVSQFPASYFGRWGMTAGDCNPGASDAKGLISVQGSLVKFYESTATMTSGTRETINSVSGDFEVVGEGQKWATRTRYQLSEDRKKLTRADVGSSEQFTYSRCPE